MRVPKRMNAKRALRALAALRMFAYMSGQMKSGDWKYDRDSVIVDLLADLRHYCDENGKDFAQLDGRAYRHYLTEKWEAADSRKAR